MCECWRERIHAIYTSTLRDELDGVNDDRVDKVEEYCHVFSLRTLLASSLSNGTGATDT